MPTGIPAAQVLPPDHQLGMIVPKGGSMCANCKFLANPQACGNKGFVTWNGSPQLPAPADQYCCDLYMPGQAGQPPMPPGPPQPPGGPPRPPVAQTPLPGGPPNPQQQMVKALQG